MCSDHIWDRIGSDLVCVTALSSLESEKLMSTALSASTIGITFAFTGNSPASHIPSYWCCCRLRQLNLSPAACPLPQVQLVCLEQPQDLNSVVLSHPLWCLPPAAIRLLLPPVSCTLSWRFILRSPQSCKMVYSQSGCSVWSYESLALTVLSICSFCHMLSPICSSSTPPFWF